MAVNRWVGRGLGFVAAAALLLATQRDTAHALEAFDGKIQTHGFAEMQIRAISRDFAEDADLTQWYNVLNFETDLEIAPDGWGPFDLLTAYVGVEFRYDCIYTTGCGVFPSVDTFGNNSKKLPLRLRDARADDYSGGINANDFSVPDGRPYVHGNTDPFGWAVRRSKNQPVLGYMDDGVTPESDRARKGYYNELLDNPDVLGGVQNAGNPCPINNRYYTCPDNRPVKVDTLDRRGFAFAALFDFEGADGEIGPYADYGQSEDPPYVAEGSREFKALTYEIDDPAHYTLEPVMDWMFAAREAKGPRGGSEALVMGPWLPKNTFKSLAVLSDRANPFRGRNTANRVYRAPNANLPSLVTRQANVRYHELDAGIGIVPGDLPYAIDAVDPRLLEYNELLDTVTWTTPAWVAPGPAPYGLDDGGHRYFSTTFGGDFSGIVPCWATDKKVSPRAPLTSPAANTWSFDMRQQAGHFRQKDCIPFTNIRVTGGTGELPFRPAPDVQNLAKLDPLTAQGLYVPSPGLRNYLKNEDLDPHHFNIDELDRSLNHGASQDTTYELKEAYVDAEFFDSRLWVRAGLQNIVWGKTELFRTTDQFNPQDLALASLPSLEESRIGLLSARAIWSFYDIGPLEDVRFEVAANFDRPEPADLGACGEPYTIDLVCQLTLGLAMHGLLGVGVVGIDRPPSAWEDIDGLEFGGRIEFRWDRFSFAITDFYGYDDFPSAEPVMFFERNVDTVSGRPRAYNEEGRCENAAPFLRRLGVTTTNLAWNATNFRLWEFGAGDATAGQTGSADNNWANDYSRSFEAHTLVGVGVDPACLKPGGAAGFASQNGLRETLIGDPDDFPVYNVPNGNISTPGLDLQNDSFVTSMLGSDLSGPWNVGVDEVVDTDGDGFPDQIGASPQNALEYHPANVQAFTVLCSMTIGIGASLDPGACAWTIFGSGQILSDVLPVPLSEVLTTIFAGDTDVNTMKFMRAIQENTRGSNVFVTPLRPLNMDQFDGRSTALHNLINPYPIIDQAVGGQPAGNEDLLTMDRTLTAEQRALLGCGPFYGTRCDSGLGWDDPVITEKAMATPGLTAAQRDTFRAGGGIDILNAEASVILQSFPGIEGSTDLGSDWRTTALYAQPGTIGFANRVVATRYDPESPLADEYGLVKLPGARGAYGATVMPGSIDVVFEKGYNPYQDGCIFGPTIGGRPVRAVDEDGNPDATTQSWIDATCDTTSKNRWVPLGDDAYLEATTQQNLARTLFHPLAGCESQGAAIYDPVTGECTFRNRDFESEYIAGTAQIFRSEMAAWSWNFLMFLVETSCNDQSGDDDIEDPNCFNPKLDVRDDNGVLIPIGAATPEQIEDALERSGAWSPYRCSLAKPYLCENVKGFLSVGGLGRNTARAGGNPSFGRRDFIWSSGGELVLTYARRNVFGIASDFAEDYTKTNWGIEFSYIGAVPFFDSDSLNAVEDASTLNLTVSVDRPTFINFLNANRTFFFNSQWFFQYIMDYRNGFTDNGPLNVLFTFAFFTGYFQDRLTPMMVTVYDFNSRSGGFLPSLSYRFTEALSVTVGTSFFIGQQQTNAMPVRGFAPSTNQGGELTYMSSSEQLLTNYMNRDEVFARLRWTF